MANAAAKATALCAVLGLVGTGLAACKPAPIHLTCSAKPSSTNPTQMTKETIAVTTAAGARVTTVAHWKASSTSWLHFANNSGRAEAVYDVGRATVGYPVKVTVQVVKGAQQATCATAFTPGARNSTTLPAPPKSPGVALTTTATGGIHLTWGAHSAGVTSFQLSLVSDNGFIRGGTYPATTKGLDTTFNGPLATACDPITVTHHVTAIVVALKSGVRSVATTLSKPMPRTGVPEPSEVTATPGSGQVTIGGTFGCPVIQWGFRRTNPLAFTSSPGRLGSAHVAVVARGDYEYFSLSQCTLAGVCSDEVHTARTFVTGPLYSLAGVTGSCQPDSDSILWTWNPGGERGLGTSFLVGTDRGWSSGTTQPNDYNLVSTKRNGSIAGTWSVSVTALSSDGQTGTPITGSVTCTDPTPPPPPPSASPDPSPSVPAPPAPSASDSPPPPPPTSSSPPVTIVTDSASPSPSVVPPSN